MSRYPSVCNNDFPLCNQTWNPLEEYLERCEGEVFHIGTRSRRRTQEEISWYVFFLPLLNSPIVVIE